MKSFIVGAATIAPSAFALSTFGPNHCVSISRSNQGTCVLRTNCQGLNLDDVEFAFTCQLPQMLQKHSFGKGGFDEVEEFDTNVKCNECGLPAEVSATLKKATLLKPKKVSVKAAPKLVKVEEEPEKKDTGFPSAYGPVENTPVVTFGPSSCISTWLVPDTTTPAPTEAADEAAPAEEAASLIQSGDGEAGTCMVQTKCKGLKLKDFTKYSIGIVVVNKDAVPVRHIFGPKSFDQEETFNTLIRGTQCLGLDEVSESVSLEADVKNLSAAVGEIKGVVSELKAALPTTTAAPTTEEAASSFLRKSHKKHHHQRRIRYDDDEAEEEPVHEEADPVDYDDAEEDDA